LEGIPHFHAWLIPRRESDEKGMALLSKDIICEQEEAEELVEEIQKLLRIQNDASAAAKNYEEWKNDSFVTRPWNEVENELDNNKRKKFT
jgi:hypothetical protein